MRHSMMHSQLHHFRHTPKFSSEPSDAPSNVRLLMYLRSRGIYDTAVLAAMEKTPRDLFVEDAFRTHAYEDTALPIACGQTISQPLIVAEMTQALELSHNMRVLEIGTGSGYQAAILARIVRRVYTVERHRDLFEISQARFSQLKITNITTKCTDGAKGWKEGAPFDRILVTAAAPRIPQALVEQLAPGGIMVLPVGGSVADQVLMRLSKGEDGSVSSECLMAVRFVPLVSDN